ncbi:replicative DNA helicase [Psychromonas sp. SP041]|uniref:replicative DNA helicase n=1 Tax=Psychromonas sp. SP041 TaxID=1365007 RepID=UPI0010C7791E|nr:replicative DNA helicase [Psychromonas sp. SP041]
MNDMTVALKAVIGSVICEPTLLNELKANINEKHIHNIQLKEIYKTICKLEEAGYMFDRISILSNTKLKDENLSSLINDCIEVSNITAFESHIQIIKNSITINEIELMLNDARSKIAIGGFESPAELLHSISTQCDNILEISSQKDTVVSYKELIPEVTKKIMEQAKTGIKEFGHKTGYEELDDMINGLIPANLIIVAARPAMGKTTFAFNIMENIAAADDGHCLMFSMEMQDSDLAIRSLSRFTGESQTNLKKASFTEMSMANLKASYDDISNLKINIDPRSSLNVTELRMTAAKVHKVTPLKMIMVDYIQLMNAKDTKISEENRALVISHITSNLKKLSKELGVPVVALSQLNRNLEQRVDKRPVNSDLKESGAIEQDADVILFLYRDEIYNEDSQDKGIAEIIIGKQRAGALGTVRLGFNGSSSRFESLVRAKDINPVNETHQPPPSIGYEPSISIEQYAENHSFDINNSPI